MPMFGPHLSVSLMLCPAYAPAWTVRSSASSHLSDSSAADPSMDVSMGMDMPMSMDMSTGMPTSGSDPDHRDHSSCPYAASATLAGTPTLFGVTVSEQSMTRLALPLPQISDFKIVPRAQSARAPPVPA